LVKSDNAQLLHTLLVLERELAGMCYCTIPKFPIFHRQLIRQPKVVHSSCQLCWRKYKYYTWYNLSLGLQLWPPYNFSSSYDPAIGMHLLCVYTTPGSASERGGGWVHLKGENLGWHRVSHYSPSLHEWTEKTVPLPCRATILAFFSVWAGGHWLRAAIVDSLLISVCS